MKVILCVLKRTYLPGPGAHPECKYRQQSPDQAMDHGFCNLNDSHKCTYRKTFVTNDETIKKAVEEGVDTPIQLTSTM